MPPRVKAVFSVRYTRLVKDRASKLTDFLSRYFKTGGDPYNLVNFTAAVARFVTSIRFMFRRK